MLSVLREFIEKGKSRTNIFLKKEKEEEGKTSEMYQ